MEYTNKQIYFILKQLSQKIGENDNISEMDLLDIIKAYHPGAYRGTFANYLKQNGYIQNDPIKITRKGQAFIKKQNFYDFFNEYGNLIIIVLSIIIIILTIFFNYSH